MSVSTSSRCWFEVLVVSKLLKLGDLVGQKTHFQLDDRALSGSRLVLMLKDFDWRGQNATPINSGESGLLNAKP
jgi:hypothetical protein